MVKRSLVTFGRDHFIVAILHDTIVVVGPFLAHHEADLAHGIGRNRNRPVAYTLKAHLQCLLAPFDGAVEIHGKMKGLGLW
jgi:hypothetical protein